MRLRHRIATALALLVALLALPGLAYASGDAVDQGLRQRRQARQELLADGLRRRDRQPAGRRRRVLRLPRHHPPRPAGRRRLAAAARQRRERRDGGGAPAAGGGRRPPAAAAPAPARAARRPGVDPLPGRQPTPSAPPSRRPSPTATRPSSSTAARSRPARWAAPRPTAVADLPAPLLAILALLAVGARSAPPPSEPDALSTVAASPDARQPQPARARRAPRRPGPELLFGAALTAALTAVALRGGGGLSLGSTTKVEMALDVVGGLLAAARRAGGRRPPPAGAA